MFAVLLPRDYWSLKEGFNRAPEIALPRGVRTFAKLVKGKGDIKANLAEERHYSASGVWNC